MKKQLFLFFLLCLLLSSCRTYYVGGNPASMLKNRQQADGLALTACPDCLICSFAMFRQVCSGFSKYLSKPMIRYSETEAAFHRKISLKQIQG